MRRHCIVCGEPLLAEPIYVCRNMPAVAQDLPTKDNVAQDRAIDLEFCQCSACGLVQFNGEPVPYYKDSTRAGERSEVLIALRRKQYRHLIETYDLQGKKILEIGAGKGGFLKTLTEMTEYGVQGYGVEYNEGFVKIARAKEHVNIVQGDPENADTVVAGGPFDAVVSFAYPARMLDPNAMMQCASRNLVPGGVCLFMVPSLEHLLKPGGFYDLVRDHIAYYSEDTLRFLLQKNGFDVLEHGETAQLYIYAIARKRVPLDLHTYWADVEPLAEQLRSFVRERTQNGGKLAVWCAGHFAFTVLSISGVGEEVSYIIDNAEFKKGRFAPGSHVPIFGPEHYQLEPVDTILILGPLYVDELVDEIREKCSPNVEVATMDWRGLRTIKP